jgi:aryl-alcohol dehydrogenase
VEIQAAVIREQSGKFQLETLELEDPRANEVLVKIAGVGICHTDIICRDQYYPIPMPVVFGHEGSGVVVKVGSAVKKVEPGDHVVLTYLNCGHCHPCKEGKSVYCLELFPRNFSCAREDGSTTLRKGDEVVHGNFFNQSSFASHALAAEGNVVKVAKDVDIELLGPLGCGIQTGAGAVINALHPHAGSSIAIFGCGPVGLSAVMAAVLTGCATIIAVDTNEERLKMATELGATHTIDPTATNPVEAIQAITGSGAHYSLECTGLPQVTRQAVDCLTLTGVCGQIGAAPLGTECSIDMNNILFGRTLRGIVEGDSIPDIFIPRMIELYKQGRFPLDKLVTYYAFEDINDAIRDAEDGSVLKAVLRF